MYSIDEYGKSIDCVTFLVADNCSTNKSVATKLRIKFIGCASHRMNLASRLYLDDFESTLVKIQKTMSLLGHLKRAAALRKFTPLQPITRNLTRWTSDFAMVNRYAELKTIIEKPELSIDTALLVGHDEWRALETASANFVILEDVTRGLQAEKLNMFEARAMTDSVLEHLPELVAKLGQTGPNWAKMHIL